MDPWDVEGWQREIYRLGGADPTESTSPVALAKAIFGRDGVRVVPHGALPGDAKLARVHGRPIIFLRKGLSRARVWFAIAHELAEYALREGQGPETEDACNAIAAAVLAPRASFLKRLRETGEDFAQLALPFEMTQTAAALRLGETTDQPLVAISPALVRVRGREWTWPHEGELRRLARGALRPGLRKVSLTDDRRRVVLIGEDVDEAM